MRKNPFYLTVTNDGWIEFRLKQSDQLPLQYGLIVQSPSDYLLPSTRCNLDILLTWISCPDGWSYPIKIEAALDRTAGFITSLGWTRLAFKLPMWQMLMAVGWFFVSKQTTIKYSQSTSPRNCFNKSSLSSRLQTERFLYIILDFFTNLRLTMCRCSFPFHPLYLQQFKLFYIWFILFHLLFLPKLK